MLDPAEILRRHEQLKTVRSVEEPAWREQAAFLRPDEVWLDPRVQTPRQDSEIYEDVGLDALQTFVSGMFSQGTNPATTWFGLTLDDPDRAKFRPVANWLDRRSKNTRSTLTPAVSQFYAEMPSVFANVGYSGNGYMSQEEFPGENAIADKALPVGQVFIDLNHKGQVDTFHREFPFTGRQVRQQFGADAGANVRDEQRYVIVHSVYPNTDYVPGRLGQNSLPFSSCYASPDLKDLRREGGFHELPYHIFQWWRHDGRAYATGPGHNARANLGTLNEIERSELVAAQFQAEPPLLLHQRSALTVADIVPSAVLAGHMTESGKPIAEWLERKNNLTPSAAKAEQKRDAIRKAFFFDLMQQLLRRPQMTATEFLGFQEENLKLLAPFLVLIYGGLSSFIARRFRILQRAGAWRDDPPPPELQGRLSIEFDSPLIRLQKVAKGNGVSRWVGALGQVAQLTGDMSVMDNVHGDNAAIVLHDAFTEDLSVLREPKDVAAIRDARAKQLQQQQMVEQAQQAADAYANVAHAQQAKTLAQGRTGQGA